MGFNWIERNWMLGIDPENRVALGEFGWNPDRAVTTRGGSVWTIGLVRHMESPAHSDAGYLFEQLQGFYFKTGMKHGGSGIFLLFSMGTLCFRGWFFTAGWFQVGWGGIRGFSLGTLQTQRKPPLQWCHLNSNFGELRLRSVLGRCSHDGSIILLPSAEAAQPGNGFSRGIHT